MAEVQTGLNPRARIHFDGTINLGHVLTILVLLSSGFAAYLSIEVRIHELDVRTADYAALRDETKIGTASLAALKSLVQQQTDALRTAVSDQASTNRQVAEAISGLKADVAAANANIKIILDSTQRRP